MTPQNKLYEAVIDAANVIIRDYKNHFRFAEPETTKKAFNSLEIALTAYEQEQPEAIAGEKTKTEIWHEWDAKPDLSYNEAAYGAMIEYASQQTAHKDQKITDLSGELHATDKLNQELQDEIAELKGAISELIQVKDWKDKYGKDEHYLKAMPIAWENVRKLIQK